MLVSRAPRGIVLAATLAGLLACASPAAGDVVRRERVRTIQPGQIEAFSIQCPPGTIALAGGILGWNPGPTIVLRDRPLGDFRWSFAFDHRSGSVPVTVTVFVVCARIPRPPLPNRFVELEPRTVERTVQVPERQIARIGLFCGRGHHPTGYGIEVPMPPLRLARAADGAGAGRMEILKAKPVPGGMELDIVNAGQQSNVTGVAQCEPQQAVARPRRGRRGSRFRKFVRVTRQTTNENVRQGRNDNVRRRCGARARGFKSQESLSAGHELPPNTGTSVFTSFPDAGPGATWNIFSALPMPTQVNLFLLCRSEAVAWDVF